MFVFSLIVTGLELYNITLFRSIIAFFKTEDEVSSKEWQIALTFVGAKLISILLNRQNAILQSMIGFQSSLELNALIFGKILKESPSGKKDKVSEGQIYNFTTIDSGKLGFTMLESPQLLVIPIQIVLQVILLFSYIRYASFFGLGTLLFFFGINIILANRFRVLTKEIMYKKDDRMKVTNETFNGLKILKLYGWDDTYLDRIEKTRANELDVYSKVLKNANLSIFCLWAAPAFVSAASIGAYQWLEGSIEIGELLACLLILDTIQEPIRTLPRAINNMIETHISMKRIEVFMDRDEVSKDYKQKNTDGSAIIMEKCNFSWGKSEKAEKKEERKTVQSAKEMESRTSKVEDEIKDVLKEINLTVKKGEMLGIIGAVGSGKSSLLSAILNNLMITNEGEGKLAVDGSISYVSQTSWIQNATIKQNILFEKDLDEDLYQKVIEVSELEADFDQLVGGDQTEIGEKGINLSGGQKARVAIARAAYSQSDIVLLDDPISALDAHVGKRVMKNCFRDFMEGKTRILVTHALQYLSYMERIVYMDKGRIAWVGTFEEMKSQAFYQEMVGTEQNEEEDATEPEEAKKEKKKEQ